MQNQGGFLKYLSPLATLNAILLYMEKLHVIASLGQGRVRVGWLIQTTTLGGRDGTLPRVAYTDHLSGGAKTYPYPAPLPV